MVVSVIKKRQQRSCDEWELDWLTGRKIDVMVALVYIKEKEEKENSSRGAVSPEAGVCVVVIKSAQVSSYRRTQNALVQMLEKRIQ